MNNQVDSVMWKSFALILLFTLLMVISISNCYTQPNDSEEVMSEEVKMTENEFHQKYAVGLNNLVWHLLEKEDRTKQDEELLINAAHTSYYHWSRIGTAINLQRGHWLIARVYAVLRHPNTAIHHAARCLELTEEHDFVDFDLAYAYEAMARAYAAASNKDECDKYLKLAFEAGEKIAVEEDRNLFFDDLNSEPWYGMK